MLNKKLKNVDLRKTMSKISHGVIFSIVIMIFMTVYKNRVPYEIFLAESLPYYKSNQLEELIFNEENDISTAEVFSEKEIGIKNNDSGNDQEQSLIGLNDVIFQPESDTINQEHFFERENILEADMEKLNDLSFLKKNFYVSDNKTKITETDFDARRFINTDTTINNSGGPKILIFHTHSTEMYKDSNENDIYEGVVGLGAELAEILNNKYGIETIHHTGQYDIVNGKPNKMGAYERMEPVITQIIKDNPSLEVAIDIHRDGVADSVHLVEEINGIQTAKLMFVDGLCKLLDNNGNLNQISNLYNPYLPMNLALSFKMQLVANNIYPNLTRKIYINAYRYSLHMLPKSLLVEVGAQTNTKQEAFNAMEPLAEILSKVIM